LTQYRETHFGRDYVKRFYAICIAAFSIIFTVTSLDAKPSVVIKADDLICRNGGDGFGASWSRFVELTDCSL